MNENLTPEELETFNTLYERINRSKRTDLSDSVLQYYSVLQYFLFKKVVFNGDVTVDIYAGRAGAFKPKYVKMIVLNKNNEKTNVDILGINVLGSPQLVNYRGHNIESERGSSLFFEDFLSVDWMVFGASIGQGLQIDLKSNEEVTVYFMIQGIGATANLIGLA